MKEGARERERERERESLNSDLFPPLYKIKQSLTDVGEQAFLKC